MLDMIKNLFKTKEVKREKNSSKIARLTAMMLIERLGGKVEISDLSALERRYSNYKLTVSKKGRKKILRIKERNNES